MDFSLSEEQELIRRNIREFCEKELEPVAPEIDEKGEIPRRIIKKMGELGFFGVFASSEYGGSEGDYVSAAIIAEEIAKADISVATSVYYLLNVAWGKIVEMFGTEEVKEKYLPKMIKGDFFIGIASTEPGGGSDLASIKTNAVKKGNKFFINGEKAYISGVRESSLYGGGYVTLTKTDPAKGHKGISLLFVPIKETKGISTSLIHNMGRTGISTGIITFKDAEVSENYLIGEYNRGFYHAMTGFNHARLLVAAACVGSAEKALEIGINYIKERKAFGRPIGKYEGIQFQLVDDYTQLEAVKLIIYKAAWMIDQYHRNKRFTQREIGTVVAEAKSLAPQIAFKTIKDVMMWHGAFGYSTDSPLHRAFKGVTSYVVGAEGAQNIMKIIIGSALLGKEFVPYR